MRKVNLRLLSLLVIFAFLLSPLALAKMGGNPRLVWDANTETDLAGYKVYYVLSEKGWTDTSVKILVYAQTPANPMVIIRDIAGLTEGEEWMFAITAYDDVGNESLKSQDQPKETFDFSAPAGCLNVRIVE